jgi:hypothetical protein
MEWRLPQEPGRAIAQAVSRWLPTTVGRARSRLRSCGICGGHSETGTDFLRVLRFPLPILVPPAAPYSLPTVYRLDTEKLTNWRYLVPQDIPRLLWSPTVDCRVR